MNVILFGGTGMVGQGVLRECIANPEVKRILLVARTPSPTNSSKVDELIHQNFFDWSGCEERLSGFDVCFFCLGVSAVGMEEAAYRRTTYDLTATIATMLERVGCLNTFIYVSGQGTNANGRQMWARVKGATEDTLLQMPFAQVFCFRPGYIQPLHGIRSKIGWYNAIYTAFSWMYPLLRTIAAPFVTSTEEVGRAMISVSRNGYPKRILENTDIHIAASR